MSSGHHHFDLVHRDRSKEAIKTLWLALTLNLLVAAAKLVYGLMTSTLAIVADGAHSIADSGASVIGLVSVYLGAKPRDDNHHYGHQKFETLAAFGISALIGLTAWEVFKHAIDRLISGSTAQFHWIGVVVMLMTMGINFALSRYELRQAKKLKSHVLEADAYHTASDIWVSVSVLLSLVALRWGWTWVDALISLFISLYLAFVSYRLIRETVLVLSDAAFVDTDLIVRVVQEVPGVLDCHRVRTRGKPGNAFVDLHIQVDPSMTAGSSHQLVHELEEKIRDEITGIHEVMVHAEPYREKK